MLLCRVANPPSSRFLDIAAVPVSLSHRAIRQYSLNTPSAAVAEKTFLDLRALAPAHPDIQFIAVSHSDQEATDRWLASLPEPSQNIQPNLQIIVDAERQAYAAWGLGTSSLWHVLGCIPGVSKLSKETGINVRPTESGSRWQTAGSFAVDGQNTVKWSRKNQRADDMPDFSEALHALRGETAERVGMSEAMQG